MIVLDSSFLIAFHNSRDAHHEAAISVMRRIRASEWGQALLPEYVFLEVVRVLASRVTAKLAIETGEILLRAQEIDFVPCSDFFAETLAIFRVEAHRGLSFADAAIVAVARQNEVKYVATFDRTLAMVPDLVAVTG